MSEREMRLSMKKWETINGCDPAVIAAHLMCRPHIIFRPNITQDGDMWCALYGENLMDGIAGFGKTPSAACAEFDKAWSSLAPNASVAKKGHSA